MNEEQALNAIAARIMARIMDRYCPCHMKVGKVVQHPTYGDDQEHLMKRNKDD